MIPGRRGIGRARYAAAAAVVLLAALAVARGAWTADIDGDEVEHAHAAWRLSLGDLPYRDFHQIHMPAQWIIVSPWIDRFASPADALLALRAICLGLLLASVAAAAWFLRRIFPRQGWMAVWVMALVAISGAPEAQAYRFRPDPFMALLSTLAVLTLAARSTTTSSFVAGVLFSVAASFSPKMLPLYLLVPASAACDVERTWSARARVALAGILGCGVGLLPVGFWFALHGLVPDAFRWIVANNAEMLNVPMSWRTHALVGGWLAVFVWLARAGRPRLETPLLRSWLVLLIASALGLTIQLIEPNHYAYNRLAALVPLGTVLGVAYAVWVDPAVDRWPRDVGLAVLVAVVLYPPVIKYQGPLRLTRSTYPVEAIRDVARCVDRRTDTCAGLAPHHAVFCRDAAEPYLAWDFVFLTSPWISPAGKAPYREMWRSAGRRLLDARPVVIFQPDDWTNTGTVELLPPADASAVARMIDAEYGRRQIGGVPVAIRADRLGCLDGR